jgi:hypothetical protein
VHIPINPISRSTQCDHFSAVVPLTSSFHFDALPMASLLVLLVNCFLNLEAQIALHVHEIRFEMGFIQEQFAVKLGDWSDLPNCVFNTQLRKPIMTLMTC